MLGLGTWLDVGGDPGVAVAAFSRSLGVCNCLIPVCLFLLPVEKTTTGILLFYKIDLSLNLILPTYVFKFYNLIEFEICLTNFKSGLLSFSRVGIRVSGVCIGPGGTGGQRLRWCGCCGGEEVLGCM